MQKILSTLSILVSTVVALGASPPSPTNYLADLRYGSWIFPKEVKVGLLTIPLPLDFILGASANDNYPVGLNFDGDRKLEGSLENNFDHYRKKEIDTFPDPGQRDQCPTVFVHFLRAADISADFPYDVLQYWYYYADNPFAIPSIHEHDWESYFVYFQTGVPKYAIIGWHKYFQRYRWDEVPKGASGNPILKADHQSHALSTYVNDRTDALSNGVWLGHNGNIEAGHSGDLEKGQDYKGGWRLLAVMPFDKELLQFNGIEPFVPFKTSSFFGADRVSAKDTKWFLAPWKRQEWWTPPNPDAPTSEVQWTQPWDGTFLPPFSLPDDLVALLAPRYPMVRRPADEVEGNRNCADCCIDLIGSNASRCDDDQYPHITELVADRTAYDAATGETSYRLTVSFTGGEASQLGVHIRIAEQQNPAVIVRQGQFGDFRPKYFGSTANPLGETVPAKIAEYVKEGNVNAGINAGTFVIPEIRIKASGTTVAMRMRAWAVDKNDLIRVGKQYVLKKVDEKRTFTETPFIDRLPSGPSYERQLIEAAFGSLDYPAHLFNLPFGPSGDPLQTRVISLSGDLIFGSVVVGSSAQRVLTIANNGNATLTVSSLSYPNGFRGDWPGGTIAAGGSQQVTVTFSPASASSYGGKLTVDSDATSGANSAAASGTGYEPGSNARFTLGLNVNPSGGGSVTPDPKPGPDGKYAADTRVTLTASPSSSFTSWSGDVSGSDNPTAITVEGNRFVTANFRGGNPDNFADRILLTGSSFDITASNIDATRESGEPLHFSAPSRKTLWWSWTAPSNGTVEISTARSKLPTGGPLDTVLVVYVGTSLSGLTQIAGNDNENSSTVTSFVSFQCTSGTTYQIMVSGFDRHAGDIHLAMTLSGRYTLSLGVNPNGSGSVTANPASDADGKYAAGTVVSLTASPVACYSFSSWNGDVSGSSNPTTVIMDRDRNVTMNFTQAHFAMMLNVNPAGGGSIKFSPAPGNDGYACGTVVTLTATPAAGYVFGFWNGDASGNSNPTTVTMDRDRSVTANFMPSQRFPLTLEVTPSGSGLTTPNPAPGADGKYAAGTLVTLTATANSDSGYTFSSWSGDAAGNNNPTTVIMDRDRSVTASFTQPQRYSLTLNATPSGSGSTTPNPAPGADGKYAAGTIVTLTATANPGSGYSFSSWSGDAAGNNNPTTVIMDRNRNMTVNFGLTPVRILSGPLTNFLNGHVYYLLAPSGWQAAENSAVQLGGHLVTINDQAEQDWVYRSFSSVNGVPRSLWIGLYDTNQSVNSGNPETRKSEFVWSSGERVSYSNWAPGEPNNYQGTGEFYVHMWWPSTQPEFNGKWNDNLGNPSTSPELFSGVVEVFPGSGPPPPRGDFNGDGKPDLIFQDKGGFLAAWLMNGTTLDQPTFLVPSRPDVEDSKWRIVGSGDFDKDGHEDIVLQNMDGTLAVWFMGGVLPLPPPFPGEPVVAPKPDGTVLRNGALFNPNSPGDANWRVAATGDLNKDGKVDLVFQHTDGTLAVWLMNGINLASASLISPSRPGNGWNVVGTGDFNSDGNDDLVFQHTDGTIAVWFMNGGAMTQATVTNPPRPDPDARRWRVVSTVDRNQDGKPDLLFQNDDGTLAVWFMDGTTLSSAQLLNPPNPRGTWKVVAPK